MLIRYIFSIVFIAFSFKSFRQKDSIPNTDHITTNGIHTIKNDSLRAFVVNFEPITYPFTFSQPNDKKDMDIELLNHFLDQEITQEENLGYGAIFYGYVFFDNNYFGLIHTRYYDPGAMGIHNYFMDLATLSYDGKIIDYRGLGCFCYDSNMGSNEYFATQLAITIDQGKISIKKEDIHATLIEDEETTDAFEDIISSAYELEISPKGRIISKD
ncbi:hypothetical protein [Aquimarina mytili]|uniref:Uncharacterized protein n=1 Tax=Aquimarina mytili TaxID=874423 RepID=A0A936ZT88_9FLAO|nr:hypothetical protein [Aquimarina mytili]MBL0684258.1 hypothetical protein [Aquimarina mytili]